jgi:hypothetical protein
MRRMTKDEVAALKEAVETGRQEKLNNSQIVERLQKNGILSEFAPVTLMNRITVFARVNAFKRRKKSKVSVFQVMEILLYERKVLLREIERKQSQLAKVEGKLRTLGGDSA